MKELKISKSVTVRTESVDSYLRMIKNFPMVGVEEEVALAERIHKGDEKALEKLIKANLRFAFSIAKQYQGRGLELMDLINEANIGLLVAAKRFDETKGFKFISFAVWWIRQQILLAISEKGNMIHKPANQINNINKVNRAMAKFEQEHNRPASDAELAEMTNISEDKIATTLRTNLRTLSFDAPFVEGEDNSFEDILSDESAPATDNHLMNESLSSDLNTVLNTLSHREKSIVCMFYGIGGKEYTLEEIGDQLHLSRERIRQIKDKSIRRLKASPNTRILRNYLC